jgi:hypothetical protein
MNYYWHNLVNGVEKGGPFATVDDAKANAVAVYEGIQRGFALCIAIQDGKEAESKLIQIGHIKGGKWYDGEFSESPEEREL